MKRTYLYALLMLLCSPLFVSAAFADWVLPRNLEELTREAEYILRGKVMSVTDGLTPQGLPYTEVTIFVDEAIRGDVPRTYTYRQFGLLKPRTMPNGRTLLMVKGGADGWATYTPGEDVVLFLYKAASQTGLRTTVGLAQGKFTIQNGRILNAFDNAGLFRNMTPGTSKAGNLTAAESAMLAQPSGPVQEDVFLDLVRKLAQP